MPESNAARAAVLGRIRAALGRPTATGAAQPGSAQPGSAQPGSAQPRGTQPDERSGDSPGRADPPRAYRQTGEHPPGAPALLDLLAERLRDYRATVHRTTEAALPVSLAAVIAELLPPDGRLVVPDGVPPDWVPAHAVHDTGPLTAIGLTAVDLDAVDGVLTTCAAAAAETGTIALDGSAGQGRRALSLVPDRHVCVVRAAQVVQTVPELIARLDPARPLTLISGPSATSDIELHRVEGVHGPRTLVVVLVSP
jgi:L-lactate dehydrogenase complex protein LldG